MFTDKSVPFSDAQGNLTEDANKFIYEVGSRKLTLSENGKVFVTRDKLNNDHRGMALLGNAGDIQVWEYNSNTLGSAGTLEFFRGGWDSTADDSTDIIDGQNIGQVLFSYKKNGSLVRNWGSLSCIMDDVATDSGRLILTLDQSSRFTIHTGGRVQINALPNTTEDSGIKVPKGVLYVDEDGKVMHTQAVQGEFADDTEAANADVKLGQFYWNTTYDTIQARVV